ncbi:MAG: S1 family peptidase [Candidatus Dormibacteria bacterium]
MHGGAVAVQNERGDTVLVTAAHVIAAKNLRVFTCVPGTSDGRKTCIINASYPVVATTVYPHEDLATITVQGTLPVASIDRVPPKVGDQETVLGHPGTHPYVYSPAAVAYIYTDDRGPVSVAPNPIVINCPSCASGDSGGGVWNAQGQLLGVVSAQNMSPQGAPLPYFFIVPIPIGDFR